MIPMKRNLHLILRIMRWAQQQSKPKGKVLQPPDFHGHDPESVKEHIRLWYRSGLS